MTPDLAARVTEALQDLHAIRINAPVVIDPASRALADCWAAYRATVAALDAARADLDRAHRALDERDRLRRERESYDCRYAGAYADSGGTHCPLSQPCQRCRLEAAEADAQRLRTALEVAETFIADDTCRHDYEKAPALHAIRAALAGKEGP